MFGSLWPAPDEMAKRGAEVAVAMSKCTPFKTERAINNKAADIPWALTPIYLVTKPEMAKFVCEHPFWLSIDEVYKNVPNDKPKC
jgi:D-xylose transport system substrate-binding protein